MSNVMEYKNEQDEPSQSDILRKKLHTLISGEKMRSIAIADVPSLGIVSDILAAAFNKEDNLNLKESGFAEKTGYPLSYKSGSHVPILGKKTKALVYECGSLLGSQRTELLAGLARTSVQSAATSAFLGFMGAKGTAALLTDQLQSEKSLAGAALVAAGAFGIYVGLRNIPPAVTSLTRSFNIQSYGIALPPQDKEDITPDELAHALKNVYALAY